MSYTDKIEPFNTDKGYVKLEENDNRKCCCQMS